MTRPAEEREEASVEVSVLSKREEHTTQIGCIS
jgi:hypothetical protein